MYSREKNDFHDFWKKIEDELGFNEVDILIPKVILTALGYTTKSSIAVLKSKKGISKLEEEFVKRKSFSTIFDELYKKHPFLKNVVCFPSGLQFTLMQIAQHLSHAADDDQPTAVQKILKMGELVS